MYLLMNLDRSEFWKILSWVLKCYAGSTSDALSLLICISLLLAVAAGSTCRHVSLSLGAAGPVLLFIRVHDHARVGVREPAVCLPVVVGHIHV